MNESIRYYEHCRRLFGARRSSYLARMERRRAEASAGAEEDEESSRPFGTGRDPRAAGEVFRTLARDFGWSVPIAQAELVRSWPGIAGEETAQHSRALHVDEGCLVVQCDSTAWATQLRGLRRDILRRIARDHPDAGVEDLRFLNPGVPSWKHGRRSVPGRGPRDTYG